MARYKSNKMISKGKILIIGFGNMGERHALMIKKLYPNLEISVLTQNHNIHFIKKKIIKNIFFDIKEALNYKPNLTFITNPSPYHISFAKKFADIKSDLFIEKPLSNTSKNLKKFLNLCKKNSIKVVIGYNLRFLESLLSLKNYLDREYLGKVFRVNVRVEQYLPKWKKNFDYKKSNIAKKELGGGVLLELSHELDIINWLFGKPKKISAWIGKIGKLDIDTEDTAIINLEYKKRLLINLIIDCLRVDNKRKIEIICEFGTYIIDINSNSIILKSINKKLNQKIKFKSGIPETYEKQIKDLINFVFLNKKNFIYSSGEDGLTVLKIIDKARKSMTLESKRLAYK